MHRRKVLPAERHGNPAEIRNQARREHDPQQSDEVPTIEPHRAINNIACGKRHDGEGVETIHAEIFNLAVPSPGNCHSAVRDAPNYLTVLFRRMYSNLSIQV